MRLVVCIKRVPDTKNVRIDPDTKDQGGKRHAGGAEKPDKLSLHGDRIYSTVFYG